MMRIETLPTIKAIGKSADGFQPFASMMRIETPGTPCPPWYKQMPFSHSPVWWGLKRKSVKVLPLCYFLSAIRQYDEDWNSVIKGSLETIFSTFSHSPVWWGLKLLLAGTPLEINTFLSAIRQYDEDWNAENKQPYLQLLLNFQPFASMMRIETNTIIKILLHNFITFSHSPVWWGLKQ